MKKSPGQWGVAPQGFFYALMQGVKDSNLDCDALNKGRRTAPSKQNKQKIWLFLLRGIIALVNVKYHPISGVSIWPHFWVHYCALFLHSLQNVSN